jgi:hypothetical protein
MNALEAVCPRPYGAPNTIWSGNNPYDVVAGDFNNDKTLDVVVANRGPNIDVLIGNGDGTFQNQTTYLASDNTRSVAAGDFNSDNNLDIAVANEGGLDVFLGNGDGTL